MNKVKEGGEVKKKGKGRTGSGGRRESNYHIVHMKGIINSSLKSKKQIVEGINQAPTVK